MTTTPLCARFSKVHAVRLAVAGFAEHRRRAPVAEQRGVVHSRDSHAQRIKVYVSTQWRIHLKLIRAFFLVALFAARIRLAHAFTTARRL
jgi:hypothetical protein